MTFHHACLAACFAWALGTGSAAEPMRTGTAADAFPTPATPEPSPGTAADVLLSYQNLLSAYKAADDTDRQLKQFARFVPTGQRVDVTLYYQVWQAGSDYNAKILRDIHPFPDQVAMKREAHRILSDQHRPWQYEKVETTVTGTGEFVSQGAPVYKEFQRTTGNEPLHLRPKAAAFVDWNNHLREREEWLTKQKTIWDEKPLDPKGERMVFGTDGRLEKAATAAEASRQQADFEARLHALRAMSHLAKEDPSIRMAIEAGQELVDRAHQDPKAPLGDPKGILAGRKEGELIAGRLQIQRIAMDPQTRQFIVEGRRGEVGLDVDLLATALRLTCQKESLYFSLDPVRYEDDAFRQREETLEDEILQRLDHEPALAQRIHAVGFRVADAKGEANLIAILKQLDPSLAARADQEIPRESQLVFDPPWLAQTHFGEILYRADRSLKELAGAISPWTELPSRVRKVEGSLPPRLWDDDSEDAEANKLAALLGRKTNKATFKFDAVRLWFTPGGVQAASAGWLDLAQVQPMLNIRATDKDHDVGIQQLTLIEQSTGATTTHELHGLESLVTEKPAMVRHYETAARHLNENFDSYSKELPEWEELRQLFRAWLLAIWIRQQHPIADRDLLERLPPPSPPTAPLPQTIRKPLHLIAALKPSQGNRPPEITSVSIAGGIGFKTFRLRSEGGSANSPFLEGAGSDSGLLGYPRFPGAKAWTQGDSVFVRIGIPGLSAEGPGGCVWLGDEPRGSLSSLEGYTQYRDGLLARHGNCVYWARAAYGAWGVAWMGLVAAIWIFLKHRNRGLPVWRLALIMLAGSLWAVLLWVCIAKAPTHFVKQWGRAPWFLSLVWLACGAFFIWVTRPETRARLGGAGFIRFWLLAFAHGFGLTILLLGIWSSSGFLRPLLGVEFAILLLQASEDLWAVIWMPVAWVLTRLRKTIAVPFRPWACLLGTGIILLFVGPDWKQFRQSWASDYHLEVTTAGRPLTPVGPEVLYPQMAQAEGLRLTTVSDQRHGIYPLLLAAALALTLSQLGVRNNDPRSPNHSPLPT